jgi:hypothetical protein
MAAADSVDSIAEELYAADLDAFTAERDAAAKRLRAAGDKAAADEVKALRKPTVSAWTVNRLARTRRKDVDALLDAGHRLREAQRTLLGGGDAAAFQRARKAQAAAIDRLAGAAQEVLDDARGGASDAVLDRIRSTLQSGSVSDDGRALLASGRLTADLAPAGFEALGSVGDLPAPPSKPSGTARRDRIRKLETELRKACDASLEAADAAGAAEAEAQRAKKEADSAERAATAARRRAESAAATVDELADKLAAAKREG